MKRTFSFVWILALLGLGSCNHSAESKIDRRVETLLAEMTLDEKIGQLNLIDSGDLEELVRTGKSGALFNVVDPARVNRLQRIAVEESRLGIPLLFGRDVIHGFHTLFPIPLGQAATFDPQLVEQGARVAAVEASAAGVRWTFSPMLDIARDPRWGRIAEGYGEDPCLTSVMGAAMVRGYQGGDLRNPTSLAACIKHFAGYGAAEGGRDYNTTKIPARELRNFYLPPFEAAVRAGAATVMTSFNEIDGVPSTGNPELLHEILREEWQFDGMVVSDWNSLGEMVAHGFAADKRDAAHKAILAGTEMDMMTFGYSGHLRELVESGEVPESVVDDAVRHVLRLKFRLGLFENPYVDEGLSARTSYAPEHLATAKRCALESAILLKNDGALPLSRVRNLLVTGPLADAAHDQNGTWSFDADPGHTVTPLAALRRVEGLHISYVPGLKYSRDRSSAEFAHVTAAARRADAVVVFLGEEAILSGEAHSLSDLHLAGAQSGLLAAARAGGKPVIAVVMAGRPLTIERDLANCDALLYLFHPGTSGGEAIADLLTGRAVPGGKTPVTFPRTAGQIPMYYNHNNTGRPAVGNEILLDEIPLRAGQTSPGCTSFYLDSGWEPLFPFGYGLSYTTFAYGAPRCDRETYGPEETIVVECTLSNTGRCAGTEVVQLYVQDLTGSIARPVKELKGFERVTLDAGESRTVTFRLPVEELAFHGFDLTRRVEPGRFRFWVAGDSASGTPAEFEVR